MSAAGKGASCAHRETYNSRVLKKLGLVLTLGWLSFVGVAAPGMTQMPRALVASQHPVLGSGQGLEHVLVWTRDIDRVTSVLAVRLGFQVRPGGDFGDGVANRLIGLPDETYLELLHFTRPEAELSGEPLAAYARTRAGTLAYNFALHISEADAAAAELRRRGVIVNADPPMTYDPDGDGPRPPIEGMFRTISFPAPPLSASDFFFVRYAPVERDATQRADTEAFRRHPNGARRLSAVWLLTADIDRDAAQLERMGFHAAPAATLPHLGLRLRRIRAGTGSILLVAPEGTGAAAEALARRGPHIYAVSFEVADLGRAQRIVERGYGVRVARYAGPLGEAIAAPSRDLLGMMIEFHAPEAN